jgi:hypothetical protein
MNEHFEKRKEELGNALLQQLAKRGQASKDIEEADREIGRISHRLDEIERAIRAEKAKALEDKKKAKKPTKPPEK